MLKNNEGDECQRREEREMERVECGKELIADQNSEEEWWPRIVGWGDCPIKYEKR